MPSPSVSPPPNAVLPARVSALRDPSSSSRKRASTPSSLAKELNGTPPARASRQTRSGNRKRSAEETRAGAEEAADRTPTRSSRASRGSHLAPKRKHLLEHVEPAALSIDSDSALGPVTLSPGRELEDADAPADPSAPTPPLPYLAASSVATPSPSRSVTPFIPPDTLSGLPVLLEAASRREASEAETIESKARFAAGRIGRLLVREKTRASGRLGLVSPFGMGMPVAVEWKSEVSRRGS